MRAGAALGAAEGAIDAATGAAGEITGADVVVELCYCYLHYKSKFSQKGTIEKLIAKVRNSKPIFGASFV